MKQTKKTKENDSTHTTLTRSRSDQGFESGFLDYSESVSECLPDRSQNVLVS